MRTKRVTGNILRYNIREEIELPPVGNTIGKDVLRWVPATKINERIQRFDENVSNFFGTMGWLVTEVGQELKTEFNDIYRKCKTDYQRDIAPVIESVRSAVKGYMDNFRKSGVTLKITK